MPKYQIEIVHTSGHTIEAEDHDHALEIAAELSDDIKSRKYFMFGEWRATEIKADKPSQLLPQNPYGHTERLIPNEQPIFMGVDLAAPDKSDYSADVPAEYLGGGGDFGGGGASSSYSSDSSSTYSSSDSSGASSSGE